MEIKLDKRHIIAMISQGFCQNPQDIMVEYNGCSVSQYRRYPLLRLSVDSYTSKSFGLEGENFLAALDPC